MYEFRALSTSGGWSLDPSGFTIQSLICEVFKMGRWWKHAVETKQIHALNLENFNNFAYFVIRMLGAITLFIRNIFIYALAWVTQFHSKAYDKCAWNRFLQLGQTETLVFLFTWPKKYGSRWQNYFTFLSKRIFHTLEAWFIPKFIHTLDFVVRNGWKYSHSFLTNIFSIEFAVIECFKTIGSAQKIQAAR